jgi:predicted enzyme related to lactoylglutathione lyase
MATEYIAPAGTPCWLDLGTSDKDKSKAFYGELLGWTSEDAGDEFGGYTTFARDGVRVAGGMQNDGTMGPDGWSVYFATDDVAKLGEATAASGGELTMEPMAVGPLGQMLFVHDPGGAFIGAWQAGEHTGFGIRGSFHGAPGWFELFTRDWEGALDFYRNVFGCTIEVVNDAPDFRYAIIMDGGEQSAGIMDATAFLPEGVPAHWSVYFTVDSAAAAVAKVTELGGAVVVPPETTPYGILATCTDSTGAMFKLIENNVE